MNGDGRSIVPAACGAFGAAIVLTVLGEYGIAAALAFAAAAAFLIAAVLD